MRVKLEQVGKSEKAKRHSDGHSTGLVIGRRVHLLEGSLEVALVQLDHPLDEVRHLSNVRRVDVLVHARSTRPADDVVYLREGDV